MEKIVNENNIIYMINDKVVAEIDFPSTNENEITITHTFVDESLRGQGMAKKLVLEVIAIAKDKNLALKATCSYAKKFLENNNI